MTLATHILVAGATTEPFMGVMGDPVIFLISVMSHYLADTIPHYDYKLISIEWRGRHKEDTTIHPNVALIAVDLLNIAIDIAVGTSLLLLLAQPEITPSNVLTYGLIVIGGILPDALQPVYILWKKFPMTLIQNMHDFWHADLRLGLNKRAILSQGALALASAAFIYFY